MRILMHPNDLVLGGASLNAIELSAMLALRGHEVLLAAPAGALSGRVEEIGLQHVITPYAHGRRPQVAPMAAVARAVRRFRPDLIHTWEFGPYLSTYFSRPLFPTAHLATVMSMEFPRYLPRTVPVTMGTRQLVRQAAATHRAPVFLLEPPVDMRTQTSDASAMHRLSRHLGLHDDSHKVVVVSRLTSAMKAEGIMDTITAIDRLAAEIPVQLLIVGDGDAREQVEAAAREVNARAGRTTVITAGAMVDPRPAYGLADVVVGMGSSALRGMAFGKPVVVVGVEGFAQRVRPETFAHFDEQGMWGVGGSGDRRTELTRALRELLDDQNERRTLGRWGRRVVAERYSLEACTNRLEELYEATLSHQRRAGRDAFEAAATLGKTGPRALRAPYVRMRTVLHRQERGRSPGR